MRKMTKTTCYLTTKISINTQIRYEKKSKNHKNLKRKMPKYNIYISFVNYQHLTQNKYNKNKNVITNQTIIRNKIPKNMKVNTSHEKPQNKTKNKINTFSQILCHFYITNTTLNTNKNNRENKEKKQKKTICANCAKICFVFFLCYDFLHF